MRIVRKGWFGSAERAVQIAVLRRYDAMLPRLRGQPWWRRLSPRWVRL
jgi:hypothetical protein